MLQLNVFESDKFIMITPHRQATRTLSHFFSPLMGTMSFQHGIPENREEVVGYTLACTIRNPYNRFVSIVYWLDYIEAIRDNTVEEYEEVCFDHLDYNYANLDVDYWIRVECIEEDLRSLPIVKDHPDVFSDDHFEQIFSTNMYDSASLEGVERYYLKEEIANRIYKEYKFVFDQFGYEKDSWKKLSKL